MFYNTPVRYKFLKKDFTETGYVEDAVTRIALVNPNISVKLINLGKNIINTNGSGDIKDVVYSIYGKEIAENIIKVNYEFEDMRVTGCVGKPQIAKSNRSNQLFFVNKRYIKDKTLTSAAEQAFKGMLLPGKYGFLVLNIEIDPHNIDVNVHPAKLEIRFQEENKVFKLVYHAIKESFISNQNKFEQKESIESKVITNNSSLQTSNQSNSDKVSNIKINVPTTGNWIEDLYNEKLIKSMENEKEEKSKEFIEEKQEDDESGKANILEKEERNDEKNTNISDNNKELNDEFEEMYRKTFGITISNSDNKVEEPKEEYKNSKNEIKIDELKEVSALNQRKTNNQIKYKFIGIAFSNYIIIEIDSDLYILDQQLANERILYEVIKKNYYNENEKDSQMMLLPDIITLNHKQMDIARDNMMLFRKAGFEVEEFGENTIKLSGVPSICIELDTKELFLESLEAINTVARTAKKEIEEKFIATIAKRVAMKSKKSTTFEEVDCLMQKLLILDDPFMGPQNKSVAFKLSEYELEKKFSKQQGGL